MTHWIFLISTLAVVYCRPQESPAVEIEKQHVVEIYPESKQLFQDSKTTKLTEKQLEESTKQILEKIALVNEKQGLTKKKPKPYQHFPFSYLRSQENAGSRESTDFKFPRDPFTNPILDYIEGKHGNAELKIPEDVTPNDNNEADDVPPGHYIKRKITHHQTMIVPNTGYFQGNMFSPLQQNVQQYLYGMHRMPEVVQKPNYNVMTKGDLEKQTVDNIKNIVENSRYAPEMPYNPYSQPLFTPYIYQQPQQSDNINVYGPYTSQQIYRPGKQQLQWPLAQYFPIVFKDPFIQLMNAFTSMVEYGPQAAPGDSCKKELQNKDLLGTTPQERTNENIGSSRANQVPDKKLTYSLVNNGNGAEITVTNDNDSNLTTVIDIEDLQITDNRNDPVQLNLNLRQSKQNHETTQTVFLNTPQAAALLKNPVIETLEITKTEQPLNDTSRQSPPIRDQILFDDEVSNEEEDKAEDIHVSHHGTKKLVSKDNTGSGIFVHKIKVRKGGVAIAGPGGIATAGSGGTAIVGPNGFAYTHPDSLAIAGSGTKVVAVEPNINLSQVILDHNRNKTRGDGHLPPRLGKIVAVGPVIYYNKG